MSHIITPEILLNAYAHGIFPMAENADDPDFFWVEPDSRGIIPLERFHMSRRLKRTLRKTQYTIRFDHDFPSVIAACAAPAEGRWSTWINQPIRKLYEQLFYAGYAHSVEVYEDNKLVGGLYGIRLNGAFFGESMFHRKTDASKLALAYLAARLIAGGFILLDTQFITAHLSQFGAIELPQHDYLKLLDQALTINGEWGNPSESFLLQGSNVITIIENHTQNRSQPVS